MFEVQTGKQEKALKVVIYGPAGVGKSTLASQFPNPIFIDTEDSTVHMDVNRLKRPTSFTELIQMVDWVKQQRQYSTLIIDTADWAEALAEKHIITENNLKSIEDMGYGAGYVKAREKYGKMLDHLTDVVDAGMNVVLVAHSKVVHFEDPAVLGAYDRYELKLSDRKNAQTSELTKEWADMVLFVNYETYVQKADSNDKVAKGGGGQRKMYTTRQPAWDAKNRFGLPDSLPMDYNQIAEYIPDLISGGIQQQTLPPEPEPIIQNEPSPSTENEFENQEQESLKMDFSDINAEFPSYLPKELTDLMKANDVSKDELQAVMGVRGHYPINTDFETIANTQPEYFTGGLAANWDGVMEVVQQIRTNQVQLVELFRKVGDPFPTETVANMNIKDA